MGTEEENVVEGSLKGFERTLRVDFKRIHGRPSDKTLK